MNTRNLSLLLILSAIWGPSFLFIKVAVSDIPPITMVLGRVAVGALLLLAILYAQGRRLPGDRLSWRHMAVMGVVQNAFPFLLFAWAELHVSSALASIVNGSTPLFTIVLAHFLVPADRITPAKALGVALGFAGLLLGSVSHKVIHEAECPVMVVRAEQ